MYRIIGLGALVLFLSTATAFAQDPASNASTRPPAIATGDADSKTSAAPLVGKNSFTKEQTRDRLKDHGYSQVKNLQKDQEGVWHATASRDGRTVGVTVDYQGNITQQ